MESFFVRYRNVLVLLLLLVVQIIGLAIQVRRHSDTGRTLYDSADSSGVRLIRLWANAIVSPPERAVEHSKTGAGGLWQNYFDLRHVRQENKDLQNTIDRLRLEQAAMLEDSRQGQRLQALLGFQQKYVYKTQAAQVIGGSGSDQSRVFYLDKGKNDGLAHDMAVITADGIVGKVREVFPRSAQVLAINDQSSGAGVILETTRIRGILRGNAEGKPQIVGILADQRIKPGENVFTAGGDEIFPRGLHVGTVEKVVPDPDRDGFINVVIKPAAYLDRLDEVLVITSTEPRFSPQQEKDIATSEELKGAEAAEIAEKKKASEIMAERLPGLTDPNAPAKPAEGKPGAPGANGATPTPTIPQVPKILPPQHPDRFSPGNAAHPEQGTPVRPATEKAPIADKAPGSKPAEKPRTPPGADNSPQPKPKPPATTHPPAQPQREP
jgi:rod shape-determining protein MreC